jgi:DNA-binding MarR family transcriptional regulator
MKSESMHVQEAGIEGLSRELRDFRRSLRVLERQIELSLLSQTECCGVSPAQCHLLLDVGERGDGSIGEFALALELDTSTLSRTVESLVRAGLLSRTTDPANRRRHIISLTAAGKEKVALIDRLCDDFYARILVTIPAGDRLTVVQGVSLIARALGKGRVAALDPCCIAPASPMSKE